MMVLIWPLTAAVILLQLIDWATTWAVLRSGRGREANPILLWFMNRLGTYTALAAAKIGGVALAVVGYYMLDALGLLITAAVYIAVVINNARVMRKLGVTFP